MSIGVPPTHTGSQKKRLEREEKNKKRGGPKEEFGPTCINPRIPFQRYQKAANKKKKKKGADRGLNLDQEKGVEQRKCTGGNTGQRGGEGMEKIKGMHVARLP